jgi:predicted ATPase
MPLRGDDVARHPVRRVEARAGHELVERHYPASIPAVAQVLRDGLHLVRGAGASRWGFFLRAETMHGWYSYIEDNPPPRSDDHAFHEMSHGGSFLA